MAIANLTAERVRELLNYDPETGTLTRRIKSSNKSPAGSIAGGSGGGAYVKVCCDGERYFAHRLIWLHAYGEWPRGVVDHIDGNGLNNRLANLRDVSQTINMENEGPTARSHNQHGLRGVHTTQSKLFRARITARGKNIHLGYFDTPEQAHTAYLLAKQRLHAGWARQYIVSPIAGCEERQRRDQGKKLTPLQVAAIRDELAAGYTQREIAARYGVTNSIISMIHTGKRNGGR